MRGSVVFKLTYIQIKHLKCICFFLFVYLQDKFLTEGELIKHYDIFAGSRVTRYGDLLREEL